MSSINSTVRLTTSIVLFVAFSNCAFALKYQDDAPRITPAEINTPSVFPIEEEDKSNISPIKEKKKPIIFPMAEKKKTSIPPLKEK